ncbi:MAG: nitrogen fixation protein NifA [Bdellovibrionales bacterium RIFCSPHIGHO2_01_FULL_40_29]|nr:MAG: nitrogen fixation protein NifA [Bdellovibrionales bacterium RIFCSPHIGHO2_01_FULL_40_29]OFZ35172.1 MAG: nitrogen fixation protein NifA [Bdellovibrionales bacterium RIFCSPHIGHO2_02_FULL_40_15]
MNWDDFEHIHVIKKLKHILHAWWNIDIVFTDERGHLKGFEGDKITYANPAVNYLVNKEVTQNSLAELVSNSIQDLRQSQNRYLIKKWDASGFDVCVFPIIIENDFVGTVVAMGFFKDAQISTRSLEVRERLAAFGCTNELIEKSVSKFQYVDDSNRQHFCELVELVAQEIVTLHVEISSRENKITELNKELGNRFKYDNMMGKSKPMQSLYALMDKIKFADSTVMIQGENGTGKELIAKSIHYNSHRKDKAFVIQNCSAFNDNLLESELFGHIKGSFTGALKDKKGLFEMADKGTFFLDEIGDTSPQMQVKLLRVLQEGTFTPVGSTEMRKVDVRIVAATNRNLREMVEQGTFREDLYYRLNVINIRVPPLRERKEDIPLLVEYFLSKAAESSNKPKKSLMGRAIEKLYDYPWPGNVRELQNEIERLCVLAGDEQKIGHEILSPKILELGEKTKVQGSRLHGKLKDALEELEREMIKEGLRRTGWNKSKLAKELGISRAGLIMKVEKYALDKRKLAR